MAVNGNGTFTYTAADGSKIDFSSTGLQTDWVSTDGFASTSQGGKGVSVRLGENPDVTVARG